MRFVLSMLILGAVAPAIGFGQQPGGSGVSPAAIDPVPRIAYEYDGSQRFGATVKKTLDGKPANKALTYSANGGAKRTGLRIDGQEIPFWGHPGKRLGITE